MEKDEKEPRKIRQGLGITPERVKDQVKNQPKAMDRMAEQGEFEKDRKENLTDLVEKHQKTLDSLKNIGGRKRKMKNLKSFVQRSHSKSPKAMEKLK